VTYLEQVESQLGVIWDKGVVEEGDLEDLLPEIKDHPSFKEMSYLEWGSILSRDWDEPTEQ
jgi:hypothetical protein